MSRLTRDGNAEPVSRDQLLRREWGQGNIHFPCSADHEQDWQPSALLTRLIYTLVICDDHTYIHRYEIVVMFFERLKKLAKNNYLPNCDRVQVIERYRAFNGNRIYIGTGREPYPLEVPADAFSSHPFQIIRLKSPF